MEQFDWDEIESRVEIVVAVVKTNIARVLIVLSGVVIVLAFSTMRDNIFTLGVMLVTWLALFVLQLLTYLVLNGRFDTRLNQMYAMRVMEQMTRRKMAYRVKRKPSARLDDDAHDDGEIVVREATRQTKRR